jgi:hypothetical protein
MLTHLREPLGLAAGNLAKKGTKELTKIYRF